MRIVIDSNVIIAAFAARGLCNELFQMCISEHKIFFCDFISDEVKTGLLKKIKVPKKTVDKIIVFLKDNTKTVEPCPVDKKICRDPDDTVIIGAALAAKAGVIITGDKDLLELKKYSGIAIVTPKQFWELIKMGKK